MAKKWRRTILGKRNRKIQVHLYLTEEEHAYIQKRMARAQVTNFSVFAREMLLNGYLIHRDFSELKVLTRQLGSLSSSINQIAKRCNETRSIHTGQVIELQREYADVKRACSERLVKMIKE